VAFVSLLVYILLVFIRPQEWLIPMGGLPFGLLDAVAIVTLMTWATGLHGGKHRFFSLPQNWLMLGIFFATLMSHVRHTFLGALISTFEGFGKTVLLYLWIATLVTSVRKAKLLVLIMIVGCVFMAADGISQRYAYRGDPVRGRNAQGLYKGFTGMTAIMDGYTPRVRAWGIFHDPNDLALMLVAMLPFLFVAVRDRNSGAHTRFLAAVTIVPLLWCIYLTNSRGGWLALGAMVAAFVLLGARNKAFGIIVAVLALGALVVLGPSRIGTISSEEGSARGRIAAWGTGNRMLKRWPLFGAGKGRFTEFSSDSRAAHNSFVNCWAELGLFGYFFWLALIMATLKDGYRLSRLNPELLMDTAPGAEPEAARAPPVESARVAIGTDVQRETGVGLALDADAPEEPPEQREANLAARRRDAQQLKQLGKACTASCVGYMAAAFFLSRTYTSPLYMLAALTAALRGLYEEQNGPLPGGFSKRDIPLVIGAELASIPALWLLVRFLL